jgi:DNA-binding SARP family transcriptional activator
MTTRLAAEPRRGRDARRARAAASRHPLGCVRGELLPSWYDDWVLLEREGLGQLRLHALEALADKLAAAARYAEAVQAAYAAVRIEPLRESAQRAVVRVHLAEGNVCEAVRAYEFFRAMLADEMGALASHEMRQLVYTIPLQADRPAAVLRRVDRA